jgi:hypothetical protein
MIVSTALAKAALTINFGAERTGRLFSAAA